jgi:hypothetical protein
MWWVYEVGFAEIAHLVTVPVTLNGVKRTFVLDSGIGFDMVRDSVPGCEPTGVTYTGKRMSGQKVTVPLGVAPSLAFAGSEHRDAQVGLLDMRGFPDALAHVDGFLSLARFPTEPLTVDYLRKLVAPGKWVDGVAVPCRVERDGPAVSLFMPLVLPDGRTVELEVDMGSDVLILDDRFVDLGRGDMRRVDGTDETGHRYTRRFGSLGGSIHPPGAPQLAQADPDVMFQSIVYDGLVGRRFLERFAVTFDVAGAALVLGGPG